MLDLTHPPTGFVEDPYPHYAQILQYCAPLPQSDGSFLIASHSALQRIYKDTITYSSHKKKLFKPKFGDSPLLDHHTTSLVFNDPPLHTRVRKILVGAMTPTAITRMEQGLIDLVDTLLDELPGHSMHGDVDVIEYFASRIPINVIGNLFDMPWEEREPLREWSLAILGALEPKVSNSGLQRGNRAVLDFKDYLADLARRRSRNPGDPQTDVLTRLLQSEHGQLSDAELLQNCIFILNAGHETTTNLIGNAIDSLYRFPQQRKIIVDQPEVMKTAVDEFLRFESPNQLGNRVTTQSVVFDNVEISAETNLHLLMGAANRDGSVFNEPDELQIGRSPNRHLAFAGGPHACLGMSLARMEGRIAISRLVHRYPEYQISSQVRSPRLRFRGFSELRLVLNPRSLRGRTSATANAPDCT